MSVCEIAVVMSTHNRPEVRALTVPNWLKNLPPQANFYLVDDASEVPAENATFRFNQNAGISRTKNKSIEIAYDSGAEHIFLVDDDIHPLNTLWCSAYTTSGMLHLCHSWGKKRFIRADDRISYWKAPRGVMLYVHRSVIESVGGMRNEYLNLNEHVEWSRRIFNAGLTPHPFMDVKEGIGLWWCNDYTQEFTSTITPEYRESVSGHSSKMWVKYRDSSEFVPFREQL